MQRRRPDLRVVVSSATLDVGRLLAFFDAGGAALPPPPSQPQQQAKQQQQQQQPGLPASRRAAVLSLEGRAYPVQVHYLTEPCPDYVAVAVQTAVDIHREDVPGDILIFLTGQEEVEEAVRLLSEEAERLRLSRLQSRLLALPLYSGLPGAQQRAALAPAARGTRKVVVATNVAETSLTIEGVVYVVDCCFTKQRCYDPRIGLESLLVAPASKVCHVQHAADSGLLGTWGCSAALASISHLLSCFPYPPHHPRPSPLAPNENAAGVRDAARRPRRPRARRPLLPALHRGRL